MEFHGYRYVVFSFAPVVKKCPMALDLLFGLRPVKSGPDRRAEQVAYTSAPPKSKINYHILWKEHLKKH